LSAKFQIEITRRFAFVATKGQQFNFLPIPLAGRGYKHQGYVLHDRENNNPLSNFYTRMLQQLGVELQSFGARTVMMAAVLTGNSTLKH
jgi:hypothetical protein